MFGLLLTFVLLVCFGLGYWWSVPNRVAGRFPVAPESNSLTPDTELALVLGPGGSRGAAHIGALKALREAKLQPGLVLGVSAGSIAACAYSLGLPLDDLRQLSIDTSTAAITWPSFSIRAPFSQTNLRRYLTRVFGEAKLEQLPIKCVIVATDLISGEPLYLTSGPVVDACLASCAIPGTFQAKELGGRYYIDGGISDPLPVRKARSLGAKQVIVLDLGVLGPDFPARKSFIHTLGKALNVSIEKLAAWEAAEADLVVRPKVSQVDMFDYSQGPFVYQQGYEATRKALEETSLWPGKPNR